MLPVPHKPTETNQFFQDHDHSPHLWWSGCNWLSGFTGRSSEVTWGRHPFFANKSRQDGDKDVQMVPNDLAHQAASEDMHTDLLGPWPDLDLTRGQILKLTFQGQKFMFRNGSTRRIRCHFHFHISHIQKVINEKPSPWKTIIFYSMTSGAKLLTLGQIW